VGGTDKSSFRLGFHFSIYKKILQTVIKETLSLSRSQDLSDKLTIPTYFNFVKNDGKGRNGTGYSAGNIMQQFRQWNQMNVDFNEQEMLIFLLEQHHLEP
jgi:hypothetical protein